MSSSFKGMWSGECRFHLSDVIPHRDAQIWTSGLGFHFALRSQFFCRFADVGTREGCVQDLRLFSQICSWKRGQRSHKRSQGLTGHAICHGWNVEEVVWKTSLGKERETKAQLMWEFVCKDYPSLGHGDWRHFQEKWLTDFLTWSTHLCGKLHQGCDVLTGFCEWVLENILTTQVRIQNVIQGKFTLLGDGEDCLVARTRDVFTRCGNIHRRYEESSWFVAVDSYLILGI